MPASTSSGKSGIRFKSCAEKMYVPFSSSQTGMYSPGRFSSTTL